MSAREYRTPAPGGTLPKIVPSDDQLVAGTRLRRAATIIDVAEHAGVARMTVSRVVNGSTAVREDTRRRVEEAIRALDYRPNVSARTLVGVPETTIAIVYSNPSAAFKSDFLGQIFEQAAEKRVRLALFDGARDETGFERALMANVTGAILALPISQTEVATRIFAKKGIPVVVIGARGPREAVGVRTDDREAARQMTRHLLELGHRRLGFVLGNPDHCSAAERRRGFRDAIERVEGVKAVEVQGDYSYASGLLAGEALLDARERPTAIFASNDDMAAAVVSVAHRRHLDVPEDLTVVGFDDNIAATMLWPPLTTIRQPLGNMAMAAFDLLTQPNQRPRTDGGEVLVEHVFVSRDSSAPPKSTS